MSSRSSSVGCNDVRLPKSQYIPSNNGTNDDEIKCISIVHISDTHQKHDQLNIPNADILIHTGDFLHKCSEMNDTAKSQINKFNHWLGQQPHPIKIIICGNHEGIFAEMNSSQILKYITNATHHLQDSSVNINGINFYGTPWTINASRNTAFGFDKDNENKLNEKYDLIPENTDILLHHLPPHNIHDLAYRHWYNFNSQCKSCGKVHTKFDHWGSTHLLDLIQTKIKPIACLFGHVHDSPGHSVVDNILFCNSAMALDSNVYHKFNVVFDLNDSKKMEVDELEENNHKTQVLMDKVMNLENKLEEKENDYKLQQSMVHTLTTEKEILTNNINVLKEKNYDLGLEINTLKNDNIVGMNESKRKYDEQMKELENMHNSALFKLRVELNQLQQENNQYKNQQIMKTKKKRKSVGCTSFLGF